MNRCALLLCILLLPAFLTAKPVTKQKRFAKISGKDLSQIFDIGLFHRSGEEYKGFYTYYGDESNPILHSGFYFKYEKNEVDPEIGGNPGVRILYSGRYADGKPAGWLHLDLQQDDSADMYARYEIDLVFEAAGGGCKSAVFKGVIGHAMPYTKLQIPSPKKCDFEFIAQTAWRHWSKTYESKEKKKSNK